MATIQRFDSALEIFMDRYIRKIHTNVRARVVGVNYAIPSVDVQPMATTTFSDGSTDSYPTIFDVPVHLPSGNGGKARLTMPIKAGDIVGLSFSEKNEDSSTDLSTHGLFAGFAVTEIFSDGNGKAIDPNNVVLENDKIKQEMTPEGDLTITTPVSTLKVLKNGTFQFTNGSMTIQGNIDGSGSISNGAGGINLKTNGETDVNGGTITNDGNFITRNGTNLDAFFADYNAHRHGGVQTGSGQTGTKV